MSKMFGLACAPAVKWLIVTEPRVQQAIRLFADDLGEPEVKVAGLPADQKAVERFKDDPHSGVVLPVITLKMRKVTHNTNGEHAVEVTCSSEDMDELERWIRSELTRRRMAAISAPGGDAFLRAQ